MSFSPPQARPAFRLNFEEAIRFIGRDRDWLPKLALGALFSFFSLFIVGAILIQGYLLIFAGRVARAEPDPLPEWQDYGEIFRLGLCGALVHLVYALPLILLGTFSFILFLPLAFAGSAGNAASNQLAAATSIVFVLIWLVLVPLSILTYFVVPAAHAQLVLHDGDLAAAFRLREVFGFIRRHLGQYLLMTVLTYAVSSVLGQIGYFACFVGIFVTIFLAYLFQYHLLGQLCWYDRTVLGVPRRGD